MLVESSHPECLNFYSIFLMETGDYPGASKVIDNFIKINGYTENIYLNKGVCELELGNYNKAKILFQKVNIIKFTFLFF